MTGKTPYFGPKPRIGDGNIRRKPGMKIGKRLWRFAVPLAASSAISNTFLYGLLLQRSGIENQPWSSRIKGDMGECDAGVFLEQKQSQRAVAAK